LPVIVFSVVDSIRFHVLPAAGVEAMTASTARSFPRHTHDQYGIGIVDTGGHASWSGRGPVEAGPGSFICVNPGEVHDGRAIGDRGRSWRILYFEPAAMAALRADVLEGATTELTFAAPVFADPDLRRLFEAAFASNGPMACETALLRLIAHLGRHATSAPRSDRGATAGIRRVRERIDADPAVPVTLAVLARELDVSRYQLIRAFARELGLTPHAYIVQRRIALARRLIRAGRALAEVAAAAGFYDQSHLTRCFVRQFGISPALFYKTTGSRQ
jgi:AraC-like DNA-binding protein/quercetin dioxygenase-like cupin family protein